MWKIIKEDIFEIALGVGSISLTILAQAIPEMPQDWVSKLIFQFGGLGLAVWLVIHHTTITIPRMQKEHREERKQDQEQFKKMLEEQRADFVKVMEKDHCRYKS